jgi:hypothetical protein
LLRDSPSLKSTVLVVIGEELPDARALAQASLAHHKEQPRVDPAGLTYTDEQVLGPWLPDGSE